MLDLAALLLSPTASRSFLASNACAQRPTNSTLENFVLYGGLALFGAFIISDTNRLLERAKFDPLEVVRTVLSYFFAAVLYFITYGLWW
jgi:hypothetical protein